MTANLSIAHLPSRALIAVSGADWRSFLQGLLTQDVESLTDGEVRFAGLLTPQGRLLYDLFVVGQGDGALLDVTALHREALLQKLTLYRLRAKVNLATSESRVYAAWGHDAPEGWLRDPRLGELGWRAYGAQDPTTDAAAYDAYRLSLGVPGPADWGSEKTYPIEANFDLLNGIDFRKGCFVGQETTSRMKRRGVIKSRMLPLVFEGAAPAPGTEVLAGDLRAGEVLSGGSGRAMALLRLDRAEAGGLTVDGRPVEVVRPGWFQLAAGVGSA
jgi:folate-binding protein YgfZ